MKEKKRLLIVVEAFADYRRGDAISGNDEIEKVLKENPQNVNVIYEDTQVKEKAA